MSDTLIALVPDYAPYLLFFVTFGACLGLPLPASLLVLTAGSFAAAGELSFTLILTVTFAAFVLGDQVAFGIAKRIGPRVIAKARAWPRTGPIVERSEALLQKRGAMAVVLSHTVVSPTCPYISYLSGAGGLAWRVFCIAAIPGALIWTLAYASLGYAFASQLEVVMETISQFFGFVLAALVVFGCLILLRNRWRRAHLQDPDAAV